MVPIEPPDRYVLANIYIFSYCSLLPPPPLFDKHSGCYGNGLIDAEKPKILKRF